MRGVGINRIDPPRRGIEHDIVRTFQRNASDLLSLGGNRFVGETAERDDAMVFSIVRVIQPVCRVVDKRVLALYRHWRNLKRVIVAFTEQKSIVVQVAHYLLISWPESDVSGPLELY